jgi:hypothetical protein
VPKARDERFHVVAAVLILFLFTYEPTEGVGGRAIIGAKARGERLHVVAAIWVLPTRHVKQVGQLALRHLEQTARVTSLSRFRV